MTLVTNKAPDFNADAILENGDIVNNFNFKKYTKNKISVLFFWPMDFTFVCPSEIITFNKSIREFEKRNTKIIGVSCDSVFVHNAWRNTDIHNGGIGKIKYIMVSDIKKEIQKSYGVEHPSMSVAFRASFIIDQKGIIRHQTVNDLPYGRNVKEIIRMIDAIIFHQNNGEVCPAEWKKGEKGIKASQEGIVKYLREKY
ncbi:Alkyl hydroperoxide reductase C [Buchnera aphidicola (Neophyllaphis podocarpi)]|uniref:peroxiredoxin C n=1 Tax=Buchnera aphidicola TaxID=9 RepID=UPI0031B868C8